MQIENHVLLAPYTTFGIGGFARYFVVVSTVEKLKQSLDFARDKKLAVLLLGGGSNMLVSDDGFNGLVIKIELKGVEIEQDETNPAAGVTCISCAGESWDGVVQKAVEAGLWGIENLSGVPGTIGGAVVQNIGAYGAALSQTLLWVEALDTRDNAIQKFANAECLFGYRNSVFKHAPHLIVLKAAFMLSDMPNPNVSYKDLAVRFKDDAPDLQAIRAAVLDIRKNKFPDLSMEGTAGSFFKNPIVPAAEGKRLKAQYPEMPLFDMPETSGVKVPLAWLLDKVLHAKGASVGGARLFEKQPLVIVAKKNTSSAEVKELAQKIKKEVKEKLSIDIEEEVSVK